MFGEDQISTISSPNEASSVGQRKTLLSAVAFDAIDESDSPPVAEESRGSAAAGLADVASAALLITGNTVGASMMVLPDVAAGPGLVPSAGLLLGIYCTNLISGLLLAEVAIKQKESTGVDAPSSFKEFALFNLRSEEVANVISLVSIFVNSCILTFDMTRAGEFVSTRVPQLGLDPTACTVGVAAALTGLVTTQTNRALSRFASITVAVLFASFAGFLIPGLANVHDPLSALAAPGCSGTSPGGGVVESLASAAPIFLTTLVYQNIVPSVTKLLDYDRTRTTLAIATGSFLPLLMYVAFIFAVLGGGLDVSVSGGGSLFTAFAAASLAGSSVASIMSLAEEYSNNMRLEQDGVCIQECQASDREGAAAEPTAQGGEVASLPSVALAVLVPLGAGFLFGNGEATAALSSAGSYGSPLLYGVLPVAMAWNLRRTDARTVQDGYEGSGKNKGDLVPGGAFSLALLGSGALSFVLHNLETDFGGMFGAAAAAAGLQ